MIGIGTKKKDKNSVVAFTIKEFMQDIPDGLDGFWAFDFSKEGYETEYIKAIIGHKQAGLVKTLHVEAEIKNDTSHYVAALDFDYDGELLDIGLESLYKEKGRNGNKFTAQFIEKIKSFVVEYDKLAGNEKNNVSKVRIHAKSGYHKKTEQNMWGGYVWANHGFDFDKTLFTEELSDLRKAFKSFCADKGVVFEDKDLKKLAKPCDFAAFDCGIKLENEEGKTVHIGKEFMTTQSWHGTWCRNDINSVQEQYAKEYNNFENQIAVRRKNSVMVLGASYIKMLKKYAKKSEKDEKKIKRDIDIVRERKYLSDKLKVVRNKLTKAMSRR